MTPDMQWAVGQLLQQAERRFYGKVIVSFEAGSVSLIRVEQTLKPPPAEANGREADTPA